MIPFREQIKKATSSGLVPEFYAMLIISANLLIIPWLLGRYFPIGFAAFVVEDGWSEYTTFTLWMLITFLLCYALVTRAKFRKPSHFAFALGAFVMAMDEISWGQRIFDIKTPDILMQVNVQGELSLHNLADARQLMMMLTVGVIVVAFVSKELCMYYRQTIICD
jgi:hypothetical protein